MIILSTNGTIECEIQAMHPVVSSYNAGSGDDVDSPIKPVNRLNNMWYLVYATHIFTPNPIYLHSVRTNTYVCSLFRLFVVVVAIRIQNLNNKKKSTWHNSVFMYWCCLVLYIVPNAFYRFCVALHLVYPFDIDACIHHSNIQFSSLNIQSVWTDGGFDPAPR